MTKRTPSEQIEHLVHLGRDRADYTRKQGQYLAFTPGRSWTGNTG